jgi:D-3-phosphoglycerate dehydrogenase / 2-oxoglutarate reductase
LKKVLFIDSVHPVLQERLEAAGYQCVLDFRSPRESLLDQLHEFEGVVLRSRLAIDAEWLNRGTQLKWIARSGSGLENIDQKTADQLGIKIISSPEGNRDAVGEHVLGLTLNLLHKISQGNTSVRNGDWLREAHRGRELKHLTFGIIGYGVMGSGVAEKLSGFGSRIIAFDKYKTGFSSGTVEEVDLKTLQECADIVSLHLPQNEETLHFADTSFFSSFAKPIWFINTARGKNVKTTDLVEAIKNGRVSGAALDVLEFEKASLEGLELNQAQALTDLLNMDQVIITPHVAGWTTESYFKLSDVLADKILNV